MPRRAREATGDGLFHVTARAARRGNLFEDHRDRAEFLGRMSDVAERYGWRWLTYCLMDTHYHLVPKVPTEALPEGMRLLNAAYAGYYNRRHGQAGGLFQDRYFARRITSQRELHAVLRYVALNPVRAGLCDRPDDWRWSGHRALMGTGADDVLEPGNLHLMLGPSEQAGARAYRDLIRSADPDQAYPVSARFRSGGRMTTARVKLPDDTDEALAAANLNHGRTMRDLAAELGCAPSTISRRIRRHLDASGRTDDAA